MSHLEGDLARDLRILADELETLAKKEEGEAPPREALLDRVRGALERCGAHLENEARGRGGGGTDDPEILVVDDDGTSLGVLAAFLGRFGPVTTASSGEEALSAVTRAIRSGRHFRLIFLDVMMPEMSGTEVLTRIRGLEEVYRVPRPAVVAMTTAMGDRDTVLRARQSGSDGYFIKPLDLKKLGAWVESQGTTKE